MGECQRLGSGTLRVGHVSRPVPKTRKTRLEMERQWVIYRRADAVGLQMLLEPVPSPALESRTG